MNIFRIAALTAGALLTACASNPSDPQTEDLLARQAAEVNTSLGREYMSRGQYEVALEKLRKAVDSDDSYAPAHTVLAVLYEQINEAQLAETHYRKAYEANPGNGDVNNNLGVYLCQLGKYDEAQRHFLKAVDDPFYQTPTVAYANAGSCAMGDGDLDKAERFLRQSLEYDAEFPDALLSLASISLQQEKHLQARGFLQRFEAIGRPSAESLLLGYRIETRLNNPAAARGYADRLRESYPGSEQVRQVQGNEE